jgi:CRISPR system Cascade subunit CasB
MTGENQKHPFVVYLEEHAEDRAMLAELRRGLGRLPGEAPSMFPYVVPFVHQRYEEHNLYLLASLFALHPRSAEEGNMGSHLQRYIEEVGDDAATTRRFVQLLNLRRDALDSPLRQHISMLKSKDIPVNWHQLLFDLNSWGHEARFVQKNWARAFWRSPKAQQA